MAREIGVPRACHHAYTQSHLNDEGANMATKYATTDAHRRAAMGLLRTGQASLAEVAKLAGVSKQLAHKWTKLDKVDWQPRRTKYLDKAWRVRFSKEKSAIARQT